MRRTDKIRAVLLSGSVILVCLAVAVGMTFSLFTDEKRINICLQAGNVEVIAKINGASLKTWSLGDDEARTDGTFANGGAAVLEGGSLSLCGMTPGDKVCFTVDIENKSNVAVGYRVRMISTGEDGKADLTDALDIKAVIGGETYEVTDTEKATQWAIVPLGATIEDSIEITVEFHNADGNNAYKNAEAKITFVVEAVQGNGVADGADA